MAKKIIEARVQQKIDTEANWLSNDLIILAGEQAFVSDKYNFKIGDGTKKFSQLEYFYKGDVVGTVTPSTTGSVSDGVYYPQTAGTYGGVVVREGYYTLLRKTGNTWSIASEVKMPTQDLNPLENRTTNLENKNGGEVVIGNDKNVTGGEVFDKTMVREIYLDLEVTKSSNLLNPNDLLIDTWFNQPTETQAAKLSSWAGRYMSGYIPVTEGETYIAFGMASTTNRRILGFRNIGDTEAIWFFNAYNSSPTGVFTIPVNSGVRYVVVAISTSYPSFIDTGMIAVGNVAIPYESYFEPIVNEQIKPKYLKDYYNKLEVDELIENIDVGGVDVFEIEKSNYIAKKNLIETDNKTSRDLDFNSKTKIGGVSETRRIINPLNKDVSNALVAMYVHSGENGGDSHERHFYLNNNSSINSVRFKANGEVLNQSKLSEIPYEFIIDNRIKGATMCDEEGNLIFQDGTNIKLSTDNLATSSTIKAGYLAGINKFGDVFYQTDRDDGILKKSTKSSGYTSEQVVLNAGFATAFYSSSFKMADNGDIFVGNYQENIFSAKIWVSKDNGDTFVVSLNEPRQHIHSIIIDRTTTPNTVYANIDGNMSGDATKVMALYKTVNLGNSWSQVTNPFSTDYGVLYAKDGVAIGGGEGAIKGSPTIYRRDVVSNNIDIVLDNFQNSQKAYRINNAVIIAGGGHSQNATPILYYSDDMYLTSKMIFIDRHINSTVMNRSFRGGTNEEPIKPKLSDFKQHFLSNSYTLGEIKPFRLVDNGNSQALFLVHIPFLPKEGIDIGFGTNYVGQGTENNVFSNLKGDVLNIEATESGEYLFDKNSEGYRKSENNKFEEKISKRFGSIYPRKYPLMNKGGVSGTEITIPDTLVTGKTVEFFYKINGYTHASIKRPILRGNNLEISRNYDSNLLVGSEAKSNVFLRNSAREYLHICLVFNASKITLYVNGYATHTYNVSTSGMSINVVGGYVNELGVNNQDAWSNFKIHDYEFTQENVFEAYYGGVIV